MKSQGSCLLTLLAGSSADVIDSLPTRRKTATVRHMQLSPNEEMQLAREELDRRRKLRLQQVREQQRHVAVCVRGQVERRRRRHCSHLGEELRLEWRQQQQQLQHTLSRELTHTLNNLGDAHTSARDHEPDWVGLAQKRVEQKERAAQRHAHALKELKIQTHSREQQRTRHIQARRKALEVEKERAAKVANLPPPPTHPIESVLEHVQQPQKKPVVVEQFSSSNRHLPGTTVETHTPQANAKTAAEEEARRLDELDQEVTRDRLEQLEKARLRGEHALRREHLTQERQRMLCELERMQAADWLRRRQAWHQAPPNRSTHTHPLSSRTHDITDERQRMLEHAFQDLYTDERKVKGDLVLQLVPEPLPAPSTSSHDNDLDLTLESDAAPMEEESEEPSMDAPSQSHGLRRLLERIRSQRDQWNSRSASTASPLSQQHVAVATHAPPTHAAVLMAKQHKDVSIATQNSNTAVPMATEQCDGDVAMKTQPSENAVGLSGMSIETGSLTSSHTQNTGLREEPVLPVEQEQGRSHELCSQEEEKEQEPSPAQDPHVHRIQQYQQHLLKQSRRHRKCVDEARRRLEEYQRTLALRHHSVTMTTTPPTERLLPVSFHSTTISMATTSLPAEAKPPPPSVPIATTPPALDMIDTPFCDTHTAHTHDTHTPSRDAHTAHTHKTHTPFSDTHTAHTHPHDTHTPSHMHTDAPSHDTYSAETLVTMSTDDTRIRQSDTHTLLVDPSPPCPVNHPILSPTHTEAEESDRAVALPPPAVVLEMLRNRQQRCEPAAAERFSLMSVLLRALQDSSQLTNQDPGPSQLTNQGLQATSHSPPSPRSANHITQKAPSVPPLASVVVTQNSALHDWHQLSAILEVDTPLNSTAPEESLLNVEGSEGSSQSELSSVCLPWPLTHSHSHTHSHSEQCRSTSLHSHTHTHTHSGQSSRLSWRDTLRLHSAADKTGGAPDSSCWPAYIPETEFLSPVDPGSFTTTVSTGSYCTSSTGIGPSTCAEDLPGVGVVSHDDPAPHQSVSSDVMATEEWLPCSRAEDIIEHQRQQHFAHTHTLLMTTGLPSWAQVLYSDHDVQEPADIKEAPGGVGGPDAECSTLQSSGVFLPLQPQTDSSSSSIHQHTEQDWDDAVSRVVGQLSQFASTSNQSDLSQLIGRLSSQSSQSVSGSEAGGRGLADSSSYRIGQISQDGREGSSVCKLIGQILGHEGDDWLDDRQDIGTSQLIGQENAFQTGPAPVDLQQSSDSFHALEVEFTLGHLSDVVDEPSLLRADSAQLSYQAMQELLFQTSIDPLQLSVSGLHDDLNVPAGPTHSRHPSQSEEEQPASVPLWERIREVESGRGILEESMISLVSESDVTLQSSFHGLEGDEGSDTPRNASPTHTPHTHTTHTLETSGEEEMNTQISDTHMEEEKEQRLDTHTAHTHDPNTHPPHTHTQEKEQADMGTHTAHTHDPNTHPPHTHTHTQEKEQADMGTRTSHTHDPNTPPHTHTQEKEQADMGTHTAHTQDPNTHTPHTHTQEKEQADMGTRTSHTHDPNTEQKRPSGGQQAFGTQVQIRSSNQEEESLSECVLKRVGEVRISPEGDLHQHTHRLYSQLEEVRQRKELHHRQETSILNRQRAREFQQKTLQKLRAKKT